MSMNPTTSSNTSDINEITLELPVWVNGKRKWVTGITKKTTFDDLIYALLMQADLLKPADRPNSSSNHMSGYAIAECIQSNCSSSESPITQRLLKGHGKVIKQYKNWQFDKLPLTILHLVTTSSTTTNETSPSSTATKLRSKIFRRFLSSKSIHHDDLSQQKFLNNYHENLNILERQKRLLDYLEEKIHETEKSSSSSSSTTTPVLSLNDVSQLLSSKAAIPQDQLIFATQLCNSIMSIQDHIDEKSQITYAVEQAISNELNHVLHQQNDDVLPLTMFDNTNMSNDFTTIKNSIYRSRELTRMQSKEMHDLDLSLREIDRLIKAKYDELKYLEYETSSNTITRTRSLTPSLNSCQQQTNHTDEQRQHQTTYDTFDMNVLNSMKEIDEDSGINSLTSEDSNHHHHSTSTMNQKSMNSQLETLV